MAKGCKACCIYCYNKQDKTCCKRTCCSWVKIVMYYVLFLAFVILLFLLILFTILDANADRGKPQVLKQALYSGAFPGSTLIPTASDKLSEPIIYYGPQKSPKPYVTDIEKFFEDQKTACNRVESSGYRNCSFQKDDLGPCGTPDFGYTKRKPCIYIKLNRLQDWMPEEYKTKENTKDLPEKLQPVVNVSRPCIWVHCEGKTDYDTQHMGKIQYFPEQAFHERYFPFENKITVNPVIAIQLPDFTPGYLVRIKCMLFAKNIERPENARVQSYVYIEK